MIYCDNYVTGEAEGIVLTASMGANHMIISAHTLRLLLT